MKKNSSKKEQPVTKKETLKKPELCDSCKKTHEDYEVEKKKHLQKKTIKAIAQALHDDGVLDSATNTKIQKIVC